MQTVQAPAKPRIYSFDIIRIIAILGVIMIHVSSPFVKTDTYGSAAFLIGNLFESASRFGVPLFVMLSGALMLNEEKENTLSKMLRSAAQIFGLLLLWSVFYSLIYYVVVPLVTDQAVSLRRVVLTIASGHYHFWYLFMIIGLYLITPILRLFVKKKNTKIIEYYLLLSLLFQFCVPLLNFLCNRFVMSGDFFAAYIEKFDFAFAGMYLPYYILGWYITQVEIKKSHRVLLYTSGILGYLLTALCMQLFSGKETVLNDLFYSNGTLTIFCFSVAIFVFLYYTFRNKPFMKSAKPLVGLSKLTFGVYLIHVAVLNLVESFTKALHSAPVEICVNFLLTTAISFGIIFILSKIPGVKKLIKG